MDIKHPEFINNFQELSRSMRKKFISNECKKIKLPTDFPNDKNLKEAYKRKEVINNFIVEYIKNKPKRNTTDREAISDLILKFKNSSLRKIQENFSQGFTNLYGASGADELARWNSMTRTISTKIGNLWEDIACISEIAISPEKEFMIKIKGVDIIFIEDNLPTYVQMKTMEDTLTASQGDRSNLELSLHKKALFVACYEAGNNWNFKSDTIPRLAGRKFWEKINLNYDDVLAEIKSTFKNLNNECIRLSKIKL